MPKCHSTANKSLSLHCIHSVIALITIHSTSLSLSLLSPPPPTTHAALPDMSPLILESCNLRNNRYRYMEDLLRLESCVDPLYSSRLPADLSRIATPARQQTWKSMLSSFPDQRLATYLLRGFSQGFRIGFARGSHLRASRRNLISASEHPTIVNDYITAERMAGRIVGPANPAQLTHTSPIGVIPKKHSDKWRIIVDLSAPAGQSVNDGIAKELCSIQYSGIDEAISMIQRNGRGCALAKLDLKSAYRSIPVHPEDRHLLGLYWDGQIYLEAALPFGLRSAPKIFSAAADALLWCMAKEGVREAIHYLDDYLFVGQDDCSTALAIAINTCDRLGIPIAQDKLEGPTTTLSFLGLQFDTVAGDLRLPEEKLGRLRQELSEWLTRKACTKRELQSLIGSLQHAASVVRPGRSFLRRLIDLMKIAKQPGFKLRLNLSARSDILWWHTFLESWNGISIIPIHQPQIQLTSDASGSWGCGAFSGTHWFQLAWPETVKYSNIAYLELIPILVAAAIWGGSWRGSHVTCFSDNEAVVRIINKSAAKDQTLAHLLRCLSFYMAYSDFTLSAVHIAGAKNTAADALSRNDLTSFFRSLPQADPSPSLVPLEILDLTILEQPDWTSPRWRNLFRATIVKA